MTNQRILFSSAFNLNSPYNKFIIRSCVLIMTLVFLPAMKSMATDEAEEIAALLEGAKADMAAQRFTEPAGNNAYEKINVVFELDAMNPEAAGILATIVKTYIELLQLALNSGDHAKAKGYLKEIRKVKPGGIVVSEAEQTLENHQKQTAQPKGKAKQHTLVGEMVKIPGGEFLMGTVEGRVDEKPLHIVSIPAFEIAKYEVTLAQFRKFVEVTGYITDAENNAGKRNGCFGDGGGVDFGWKADLSWRNPGYSQGENHPVVCVSWNDTQAYIAWLNKETGSNYSLSSEAKWEYAVRAGSATDYHFGNDKSELCAYANVYDEVGKNVNHYGWRHATCDDGEAKTAAVGQYQANAFGLHDMHGNVWEWVEDCWKAGYHDAPSNGEVYKKKDCRYRVTRGGSWYNIPLGVRSANRYWYGFAYRSFNLGFRIFRKL